MLGYVNNEKVVEKIKYDVLMNIENQDIDSIVKYTLVLKSFIDFTDLKQIGTFLGMTTGAIIAFNIVTPIGIAAGATLAIASLSSSNKNRKAVKLYKKLLTVLLMSLDIVHNATPEQVQSILDRTSAEDLVDFLENEGCTVKND
jgi:uncharacterized membrane protein required for colicin V production